MRKHRSLWLGLAAVAITGLAVTGCFITSAQIFAHFDLPNPVTFDSQANPFQRVAADLNQIEQYREHKAQLRDLSDIAVVGTFTNLSGPAGTIELWITPGPTNFTTVAQVRSSATRLWGPESIGASGTGDAVVRVTRGSSGRLFSAAGKAILINQAKGDGMFTLYAFGTMGTYKIRVDNGSLVLVLDADEQ